MDGHMILRCLEIATSRVNLQAQLKLIISVFSSLLITMLVLLDLLSWLSMMANLWNQLTTQLFKEMVEKVEATFTPIL